MSFGIRHSKSEFSFARALMEGTFRGSLREKTFGFVSLVDGSPDVCLHQSKIAEPSCCTSGTRLSFDVEETGKGRNAVRRRLQMGG